MSNQAAKQTTKAPKVDRWGLEPVARGHLRGQARNLRASEAVSQYGHVQVVEFDLWIDEGVDPVPIRMTGTDFQGRVWPDQLYDIPDPTPDIRPIEPWQIVVGHNPDANVIAHMPGREFTYKQRGLMTTVMVLVAPFIVVAILGALAGYFLHWFG